MSFHRKVSPTNEVSWAGPLSSASSSREGVYPSRSRRTKGSSEGEGTPLLLEDDEIWNEDYRCGGPNLARFPITNQHVNRHDPLTALWDSTLEAPVTQILNERGIRVKSTGPMRRAQDSLGTAEHWKDTILIMAEKEALDDSWYRACKSIRKLFVQKGLGNLNIEITDPRAYEPTLTYPILSSDPFVAIWPGLRPDVLTVLEGKDWVLLCILRRGKGDGEKRITVCVTIREDSGGDWVSVREGIIGLLDTRKLYDVAIEICRGEVLQPSIVTDDAAPLDARDWSAPAKFGGSLAPRGSDVSSSTFGGFLEIQLPSGEWRRMGITNYRCIFGGQQPNETFDKHGINSGNASNNLELDHPSANDHERSITGYYEEIASLKAATPSEVKKRIQEGDPSVPRSTKIGYERQMKWIEDIQHLIDTAKAFHKNDQQFLGKVYAGSGYRMTSDGMMLDWACINVREERMGRNEIPQENDVDIKYRKAYAPDSIFMQGVAPVEEDMRLVKIGRRTGFTEGQLDGIRLADIQSWVQVDGVWSSAKGRVHLVAPLHKSVFGDPGDSGSFVMSMAGSFVGLYMGGDRDRGTGLFIAAKDLFEDIKRITGATDVRVPFQG